MPFGSAATRETEDVHVAPPIFPRRSGFAIWRTGEFSLHAQNTETTTNMIGRERTNLLNYVDALIEMSA